MYKCYRLKPIDSESGSGSSTSLGDKPAPKIPCISISSDESEDLDAAVPTKVFHNIHFYIFI